MSKKNLKQTCHIRTCSGYPEKWIPGTSPRMTGESGRSMVEMLGVLAIIGVLSVGGIAGYTSAMRQYKANEIVNATSMLYMMGASQNQGAGDKQMLYSAALGTVPSGVSEITYNTGKTITLAFTDTDVCPLAKNKLGDKATGECPTLTVSFGEVTIPVLENTEANFVGKECNFTDQCYVSFDGCQEDERDLLQCINGQIKPTVGCAGPGIWPYYPACNSL